MALIENNTIRVIETLTSLARVGNNLLYVDELGNTNTVDLSPLIAGLVQSVTGNLVDNTDPDNPIVSASLGLAANILTLSKGDGSSDTVDLSLYLDDTNLARIVSGTLNGATGIATFTRDDSSTFTLDLSNLIDIVTINGNIVTQNAVNDYTIDETITSFTDNGDGTFTYTDENNNDINTVVRAIDVNGTGSFDLAANTNYQTIDLGTDAVNVGGVFSNASGVITYTGPTVVAQVGFSISGVNNETGTRSTAYHSIFLNGTQLTRTERYSYHRTNGDGFDSAAWTGFITLNSGDTIEIRSRLNAATDDIDILLEQSNIFIKI